MEKTFKIVLIAFDSVEIWVFCAQSVGDSSCALHVLYCLQFLHIWFCYANLASQDIH